MRLPFAICLAFLSLFVRGEGATRIVVPSGCIAAVSPGDHTFSCFGLRVDARVPAACAKGGCGLILELHGDTGTGLPEDAHLKLRDLGAAFGYIVVAPTGPPIGGGGSTWSPGNDATLVDIVRQFAGTFGVDAKKIHVTGFSRGGFGTWRLLCDHADLFASGAPGAAGSGCFASGRMPSRKVPILMLMGRTDHQVSYQSMTTIRDAAIARYGATGPEVLARDASYTHNRWSSQDGAVIETFDHAYQTIPDGPWGFALGHCIPGSTVDPRERQYALACKSPNAFVWGREVMAFFRTHPKP